MNLKWSIPWNTDRKLDLIINLLTDIRTKEVKHIMAAIDNLNLTAAKIQSDVAEVVTAVTDEITTAQKTIADLKQQLADALASGDTAALNAQIETAVTSLNDSDAKLNALKPA